MLKMCVSIYCVFIWAVNNLYCSLCVSCRDAIPPYKLGSKKQLQREMQRNMRMNGQVSLPPFPVSVLAIILNYTQTTPTSPPIKKHYPLKVVDCSCCCALSGIMTLNKLPHRAK